MYRSSSHPDRGSALLEVMVLGAAMVVMVLAVSVAAGRIIAAGEAAREAARTGSVWGARYGDADLAERTAAKQARPGSTVTARRRGDQLVVTVEETIELLGVPGAPTRRISHTERMDIAPYRSNRG